MYSSRKKEVGGAKLCYMYPLENTDIAQKGRIFPSPALRTLLRVFNQCSDSQRQFAGLFPDFSRCCLAEQPALSQQSVPATW